MRQCPATHQGRPCCLNIDHVNLGYQHLCVGEDGVLLVWVTPDITPTPPRW